MTPQRPVRTDRAGRDSPRPPASGSSTPSRPAPPRCRSGPGPRSAGARTPWSSPPPARARRSHPSCPPLTAWVGSTPARRPASARSQPTACGSSTSLRSRRWERTWSATCAGRWRESAPSAPPARSRWGCARGTRPRGSVVGCAATRPASSSRRRSRSISCSPAPCGRRCGRWRRSSSTRSTPSPVPSAARTWPCPWSASMISWGGRRSASACPPPSRRRRRSPASSAGRTR